MVTHKYSFELKSNLSELETLCQHLNKLGKVTGLSEACITDVNICLDELFTNIVSYGFVDDLEHIIRFTINVDNNMLTMNIEDDGIPFNPLEKKDPEIPAGLIDVKIGGLGASNPCPVWIKYGISSAALFASRAISSTASMVATRSVVPVTA